MAEGKLGISVILENDAKRVFNLLNKNLDEVNKKTELTITAKSEKAVKAIDAMLGGVLGDAGVGSLVKPIMQMSTTTKEFERNIAELKNIMIATRRYVSTDFLLSDFKELTNKQKFRFMQAIYQNRKKITDVESKDELGNTIIAHKKVDRNKTEMANYLIQDNVTIKQLLDSFNGTIKNAFIKSLTNQLAKSKNDVSKRYQNAIQSALSFKDINETIRTIDIKEFDDSLSKLIMPIDQLLLTLKKLDELKRKADTASSIDISEKYLEEIDKLIGAENAMGDYRARIKHVISSLIGTDKTNAIFNNLYGQKVNENIGLIDDDEDDIKFAKSVKDYVLSVTDPAKFKKKQAIKTLAQKATKETQAKEQQEEIHNQELMQKALEETSKKYADISDQVKKYAVSLDEAFEAANKLFEASGNGSVALGSKDEKDFIGFYQRYLSLADEDNVDKIDPIYKMFEKLVKKSGRNLGIASNVDDFTYEQLEVYKKLSAAESELTNKDKELKNDTDSINSSMQKLQQTTTTVEEAMRELNSTKFDGTEKSLNRIIELLKIAGIEAKNILWHEGTTLLGLNSVGSESMIEALDQLTNDGSYGSLGSGLYLLSTIAGSMDAKEFQDKESLFAVDKSKYKLFQTKTNKMAENLYNMFNIMEKLIFSASEYRGFDIELKNVNPESIFKQYEDVCKAIGLDLNTLKTFIDNAQKQVKNIGIINDVVDDSIYPAFKPVALYQNKATREQARKQKDELQQMQRYPTQLMKQLGWQGIDNTGTTLDDFYHGSIIYDIDRNAPFIFEIKNAQAAKNIVDSLYAATGIVPLDRSGSTSYKKNQRKIQEKKLQESNDYIKLIGTDPSKKIPVYNFSEEKKATDSKAKLIQSERQLKKESNAVTNAVEKQGSAMSNTAQRAKELEKAVHAIQIAKKNINRMPQSEVDASIDAIYKKYPELQPLQKHIDKLGMNNTARIRFYKTPQWRKMINGLNVSDTINANTQESNANEQAAISAKQHVSANNQLVKSEQEVASAVNNTNNILEKRSQITQFQPPISIESSDRVKSQIVDYMNRQTDVRNFMSNLYQQVLNGVFGTISSNTPVNVSTKFQPPMDMSYFNNAQSLIADFVKRQGDIRNFVTNMYQQVLDSAFAMMTYKIPTAQTQKSNQASQSSETAISNMISANEKLAVSAEQAAASVEHEANVVDKLNGSQNNGFELIGESYSTDFVILDDSTSQNGNKYKNRKLKGGKLTGKKYIANDSFDGQSIDEAIKKEAELQAAVNNVTEAQQKQGEVGKTVVKNNQKNSETKKSSTESESKKIKQNTEEAKNKAKEAKALYEELANLERQHQKDLKQQTRDDNLGSDYWSQEISDRINDYDNKLSRAKQLTEEFKKVNVSDKSEEWTQLNKSIKQYEKNLETINNKNKNNLERRVESYGSSFDKIVERLSSKDGLSSKYSDKYIETKIQEGKKYQKQLSDFSAEWLSNLDTKSPNFSYDLERAALEFDELQKKVNKFKSECKNLFDFRSTSTGIEQIKKLENEIDKLLGYSKISSDHKTELSVLKNRLSGDITESDFTTIKSRVSDINKEMQKFGEKGASFIDKVKGRFQSLGAYLTTFVSFYQVVNVIREITNSVREFDDALTEMRKVSNESVDTLKDYQKQSFDMAKSIGTDALSLQNSTADFMRLGQTLEEAKDSAMSANVLMNVSEFESIDQATDSLIAMKSAYKDLDNMQIIDKLNEVGNNMPIATAGLATALQDSASALTTANNSIDESIALITAGNAITQDPSKTGKILP